MGEIIQPRRWRIAAGMAVLGTALVVVFDLYPRMQQAKALQRWLMEVESPSDEGLELASQRARLQETHNILRRRRLETEAVLLPADREPELLEVIHHLAREEGLGIDRWTPGPLVQAATHAEQTIQLQVRGGFLAIGRLIDRLETADTPVALRTGRLERRPDTLAAHLELTFFLTSPTHDSL